MDAENKSFLQPLPNNKKKQPSDNNRLGFVFLSLLIIGITILYIGVSVQDFDKFEIILNKMLRPIISA